MPKITKEYIVPLKDLDTLLKDCKAIFKDAKDKATEIKESLAELGTDEKLSKTCKDGLRNGVKLLACLEKDQKNSKNQAIQILFEQTQQAYEQGGAKLADTYLCELNRGNKLNEEQLEAEKVKQIEHIVPDITISEESQKEDKKALQKELKYDRCILKSN